MTIAAVAFGQFREDEAEMFQNGLLNDPAFEQLAFQWQKALEKPWCCACCRPKASKAARRLRVALRRVVTHKRPMPPIGPPLLAEDDAPIECHTPSYRREIGEQMHLLQDRTFRNSALAIDLAENILLAAEADAERARTLPFGAPTAGPAASVALSLGGRTAAPSVAGGETTSSGPRRVIATPGGDIGPGGPERRTSTSAPAPAPLEPESEQAFRPSGERFSGWVAAATTLANLRLSRSSQPGRPPSLVSGTPRWSESARPSVESGRPPRPSRPVAGASETESLPDSPKPNSMAAPPAESLRARHGGPAAGGFEPFEVEGRTRPTETSYAPFRGITGAFGSALSLFRAPQREVGASGSDAAAAEAPTPPDTPTSQRRPQEQNFGSTERERNRLIAAARKNLEGNDVEVPTLAAVRPGRPPPGGGSGPGPAPGPGLGAGARPSADGTDATSQAGGLLPYVPAPSPQLDRRVASVNRAWAAAGTELAGSGPAAPAAPSGAENLGRDTLPVSTRPSASGPSGAHRGGGRPPTGAAASGGGRPPTGAAASGSNRGGSRNPGGAVPSGLSAGSFETSPARVRITNPGEGATAGSVEMGTLAAGTSSPGRGSLPSLPVPSRAAAQASAVHLAPAAPAQPPAPAAGARAAQTPPRPPRPPVSEGCASPGSVRDRARQTDEVIRSGR